MVKNRKTKAPARRRIRSPPAQTAADRPRREEEDAPGPAIEEQSPRRPTTAADPRRLPGRSGCSTPVELADYHTSGGRDARITLRLHPDLRDLLIVGRPARQSDPAQLVELTLIEYGQRTLTDSTPRNFAHSAGTNENSALARDPHPFARRLYDRLVKNL